MAGFLDTLGKIGSAISPVGNVLSGIGSVVGAISGAKSARDAQREANETNIMLARENNELQYKMAQENNWLQQALLRENNQFNRQQAIDMFMMENYYNSPVQQMERLRKAGLNPAVMMEGAGGSATGNADGSTPSAATAGITPQLPSLTTPHVEPLPTMATGFLSALQQLSQIKLTNAQAKKTGAEEDRITKLVDEEVLNLMAERQWKEAQIEYQDLMTRFENLYGHDKRAADIQKTISEFVKNKMQGNEAAARAALAKAEEELTKTKDNQLKLESPILIANLKKLGVKIDEEVKTEKSKQSANYAAGRASDAAAENYKSQTRLTNLKADEEEIVLEALPTQIVQDMTLKDIETISNILTSGRAKNYAELIDLFVSKGGRAEVAKQLGEARESEKKKLESVLSKIKERNK